MKYSKALLTSIVGASLAACGGGGSDTAVSANPPAPTPAPSGGPAPSAPTPAAPAPIGAPAVGKLPEPLAELPSANGATFSGAQIARALAQPVPSATGRDGRQLYRGLDGSVAAAIASDGTARRTALLAASGNTYVASRQAVVGTSQVDGGIVPTLDGVPLAGTPLVLSGNFAANQQAGVWTRGSDTIALWPTVIAGKADALRLCWLVRTSSIFRFACTDHRGDDGRIYGAAIDEVVDGDVYPLRWQWESTPRTGGWTLADYAPGGDAEIPARTMSCTTTSIGPGAGPAETSSRSVALTPADVRLGDVVYERHAVTENTVSQNGNRVTYRHAFSPAGGLQQTEYTLEVGRLVSVTRTDAGSPISARTVDCR